jgi:hypothetical protein
MVKNEEFTANWLVNNIQEALVKASNFNSTEMGLNSGAAGRIADLSLGVLQAKSGDEK